jgi:hypothetical protein
MWGGPLVRAGPLDPLSNKPSRITAPFSAELLTNRL